MQHDILSSDVRYIKGVGDRRAQLLYKLGVKTCEDLLKYYPRAYEDWSNPLYISEAPFDSRSCVKATVTCDVTERPTQSGMKIYTTYASDGRDMMKITIFNNKYAAARLKTGETYLFFGRMSGNFNGREMLSPLFEVFEEILGLHPVYKTTEGLTSKIIGNIIKNAITVAGEQITEVLSAELLNKYSLCSVGYAIKNIHFPQDEEALSIARRRLTFEEQLVLQLGLLRIKGRNRKPTDVIIKKDCTAEFFNLLPFEPTGAQKKSAAEIFSDLSSGTPMSRLLQGDVGSGKTAVAAAAIFSGIKNGWQCALMAPTEILATQHYNSLMELLKNSGITTALLIGSTAKKQKQNIYERLKNGEIQLVVGTHALLQKDVEFERLGFVVTDEQHRFGVVQRAKLAEKGQNPHMLVMSATPIPRTLALIIYGDLDISVLDELPPGRQKIDTYAVDTSYRERIFKFIKKHLDEGRQAYLVCPLVEEGETDELVSATEYANELSEGVFKEYSVGLLHGKMKPKDKDKVMSAFSKGEINLLVSTTVIEVGIDVPNAVLMVIENADRFGLSQLHQLRGRVGRGKYKSTCILISNAQNDEAQRRLKVMCETNDGFKIADEDLKLRGPGDFFGSRQHGLPELKISDILTEKLLKLSSEAAKEIYKTDPQLEASENILLSKSVANLFSEITEKGLN